MAFGITLLVIIIIIGLIGIVFIINYNKMQELKIKLEQSENRINDSLRDRFDAVYSASNIINDTIEDKKNYLKKYIDLKDKKINNYELDRKLTDAVRIIKTLINDHKELEKNKEITNVLNIFNDTEEILTASKRYYNNNATSLNELIRKIPSNIIAKLIHIKEEPYYEDLDNKKNNMKL